ncbi:ATP-binding protein [Oscillatoria amoena NRMC-F 0135]|nr:ATP-binding protein [Geitlerinema splendidum]MDL5048331.1 ATP-binding protein [Oscillatoria amoena NRMC-F 0135]
MKKTKILIVEDETIIAMDIRSSLESMGYHVVGIATTGESAIQKVKDSQPDLVLMDINIRGEIDGIQTAEQIKIERQTPIIYLTAHTDIATLTRAKATEPFGYIVKPFEEQDLYTTVEIALSRAKAEAEVLNSLEKEKEINELKSRFVSMVSHEFRTPLSTILFSAGLLEKYGEKWGKEKHLIHLHRIQTAVQQMTTLLEDVLLLGKAEANRLEFKPVTLNIRDFCADLMDELQLIDNAQHQFVLSDRLTQSHEVFLDERLLRIILSNLLSNAIKYSKEGKEIELEISRDEQGICFQVKDGGIGIPEADRKHLFQMFHRAQNVGEISGTGLGLAIVKRAVDLHKGEISLESQEGVGTIFRVRLPLNEQ